nr:cytochrome B5-like protein isoform X2 [Ipomoea trifida]
MELAFATLVLGILLGLLIVIPMMRNKSDQPRKLQENAQTKVFDVTSYVEEHPGGDAILAHAGDDSTEGFYGPQHATRVFEMIDDFCIGELEK